MILFLSLPELKVAELRINVQLILSGGNECGKNALQMWMSKIIDCVLYELLREDKMDNEWTNVKLNQIKCMHFRGKKWSNLSGNRTQFENVRMLRRHRIINILHHLHFGSYSNGCLCLCWRYTPNMYCSSVIWSKSVSGLLYLLVSGALTHFSSTWCVDFNSYTTQSYCNISYALNVLSGVYFRLLDL